MNHMLSGKHSTQRSGYIDMENNEDLSSLTKEDIIQGIAQLRKNIKQKHRLLKREMMDSEELWETKLKPISEPLKKLVEEGEQIKQHDELVGERKRKMESDVLDIPVKRYLPTPVQGVKRKKKLNLPTLPDYESDYGADDEYANSELPRPKRYTMIEPTSNDMESDGEEENSQKNADVEMDEREVEEMDINNPSEVVYSSPKSGEELLKSPEGRTRAKHYIEQHFKGNLAKEYFLKLIQKSKSVDYTYGVRVEENLWMLGDKPLEIDINDIIIDGKRYQGTRGLYELIFMNIPNEYTYDDIDLDNYAMILRQTNAHRANYSALGKVKSNRGNKYKNIIAHIVTRDVTTHEPMITYADQIHDLNKSVGTTPRHLDRSGKGLLLTDSKPNVIYFDDPNELVDRLRILLSSEEAGNTAHKNEVNAIIEELLEWDKTNGI